MTTERLVVIRTLKQMDDLLFYIREQDILAVDTETTGVEKDSQIVGFSVCADINLAYYVILAEWHPETKSLVWLDTREGVKDVMGMLKEKKLIGQNFIFDASMIEASYGVSLIGSLIHDTLISGHLLDENRSNGLKERGLETYGEDATKEQKAMKASVLKNGGVWTVKQKDMYMADPDLLAYYGAKDAILTLKLFYKDVEELYTEGLDSFYYEEESLPLYKGPTYQMNTIGLRVDHEALQKLRGTLEAEIMEAKAFVYTEIHAHIKNKYPGTNKRNTFNIGSTQQMSWLLFGQLGNEFSFLTDEGREVAKALDLKTPYSNAAKREFIAMVQRNKGRVYCESKWNPKTRKMAKPKKIGEVWKYLAAGKLTLEKLSKKYKWVERYLEYAKAKKLLSTYVIGIQNRMRYNIIRPSFLQHGTTSGRYSSKNPNFQNLPRDEKRIKACIISRPGKVFIGADYSQLEPRIFASLSGDPQLCGCFESGDDFYSVVGAPIFASGQALSLKKSDKNSFAKLYPEERQIAKEDVSLATVYGSTAWKMSQSTGLSTDRCQEIINDYFDSFPKVYNMMMESHDQVKTTGKVHSLFGRPRRIPLAMKIPKLFGNVPYYEIKDYTYRNLLNLATNHRIQSSASSVTNRAAIAFYTTVQELAKDDPRWLEAKLLLQVHDELVVEVPEELAEEAAQVLKYCMEETTLLPNGVKLVAEPIIGRNLAEIKG